jgi:cytoskeletal protein CcmA (bactofilin family)
VTIAPDETIDDTLIALGDHVTVEGTINGDLIALARRVTITGTVKGDVLSAARDVEITGTVEGNVLGFAQTMQIHAALRNLYGFGQTIIIGKQGALSGDATMFGQSLNVEGAIGRDLNAFAQALEVRSDIASDIRFHGNRLILSGPVKVGGNLDAEVPSQEAVTLSNSATVGGSTNIRISQPQPSRYSTVWFYFGQILRTAAAFVTGLVLMWLVPALGRPHLQDRLGLLKAGGIGFLAAVATPVAAVLIALTLIGLPIGLALIALWILGLYLAKIVMAVFLGRALLSDSSTPLALALLLGLVLIIVVINLPYIGGLVNFLLTLIGLGTILLVLYQRRTVRAAVA